MRTPSGIGAATAAVVVALGVVLVAWGAPTASADTVTGEVVSAQGRFTADRAWIVTDAVIRTDAGDEIAVVQPGGRAGGLAQRSIPSPPLLERGMRVTVETRRAADRRARPVHVVEDVTVHRGGAAPYVRTGPTEAGNFLRWASGCVFISYDAAGTDHLAGDLELEVLDDVLATWQAAIGGCSYLELVSAGRVDGAIGNDGLNTVVFRDDVWCRPATDDMPEVCLPGGAAGLTTVTYVDDADSSRDGEIVDADIELNGEEFAISTGGSSLGDEPCLADLANTFTHELGHLLGLDHTCLAPTDDPKIDDEGNPVPRCSATTDPAITEATMYNFQDCGETKKATPEPDDVDAVCDVYPADEDPGTCEPPGEGAGCCSTGGGAGGAGAGLLTLLLAAAACRRERAG